VHIVDQCEDSTTLKGEIVVESDNYSVMTIMKVSFISSLTLLQDQISAQASQRKMQVSMDTNYEDNSVYHILNLLHPLVDEQYQIANQN
jgi:hypothetical protein